MKKPRKRPKNRTYSDELVRIFLMLQEIKNDMRGMRGEANERLRVIESDIENMQKYIGEFARRIPILEAAPTVNNDSPSSDAPVKLKCQHCGNYYSSWHEYAHKNGVCTKARYTEVAF